MLNNKTVLIVEDNAFLALDLSSVVEELEGRVAGPVATAREALQLVGFHEITGAVIDCDLVDVDVAQIVMQLAEKDIPVVILTAVGPSPVVTDILPEAPVLVEPVHPGAVLGRLIEEIAKRTGNEENEMADKNKRAERREQQAREVEESQAALRESISETERLVGESDHMLRRHRKECEDDDAEE